VEGCRLQELDLRHNDVTDEGAASLRQVHSDEKLANRESRVWHGATETGP
jgi:hypothetical protein